MTTLLRRLGLIGIAFFLSFPIVLSQAFTEETSILLSGVYESTVAWGDYDNDGDLDLLLTGYSSSGRISIIYQNDAGVFTDIAAGLIGVSGGSAAWGDYDNDGDLDILLTGYSNSGIISVIYRNDGGVFTDINAGLLGVASYSSVDWGDYDNDGDLDILLAGNSSTGERTSKIYRNDNGVFTDIEAGLSNVSYCSVAWGDYDSDGDLDILLAGSSSNGYISRVYKNDAGLFTDIYADLPGVYYCSVDWGDYDSDGDLDILLTGYNASTGNIISNIYRNDDGIFFDIEAQLAGVAFGTSSEWGDYDNDGDLDILVTGYNDDQNADISLIYRNDGGVFTDINAGLTGTESGSSAWGDFDNDGDLDIVLTGMDYNTYIRIAAIYINNATTPNTVPSSPSNLQAVVTGTGMNLSWNKATDTQTLQDGLSYNLYIGTSPGTVNKRSPMAVLPGGYRKIVRASDIKGNAWTIKKLPAGTYYWSVQTIDNNFAGSPFATPGSFIVPFSSSIAPVDDQIIKINETSAPLTVTESSTPTSRQWKYSTVNGGPYDQIVTGATGTTCSIAFSDLGIYYVVCESTKGGIAYTSNQVKILVSDFIEQTTIDLTGVKNSSVAWGDYDNDGDLDILLTGNNDVDGYVSKIYRNDGGVFTDILAGLSGISYGSVSWGDYDNDGDLDILLIGNASSLFESLIYRNDGGVFTDIGAGLDGVSSASADWGDYDNDGDLDIVLTGNTSLNGYLSKIYRNDGGMFIDIEAGLKGVSRSSVKWGDYDNDGDLDILLAGYSLTGYITRIYRNDNGVFTDIVAGFNGLNYGSVAWGDYDNDGDLDVLLSGNSFTKIYRNTGGTFSEVPSSLPGLTYSSVAWGDYDNDGDLDILLAGSGFENAISKIYQNNDGSFTEVVSGLPGILSGSVAWGDYDNDGDLDILLTGSSSEGDISKIYENYMLTANIAPSVATNLQTVISPNRVAFSWDKSSDISTPTDGLSYNLYIGSMPGSVDKKSPMASLASGFRKIVREGNKTNSWTIKDLQAGSYYWSIQAIDNSFAGSPFASEASFTVGYSNSIFPIAEQILVINQNGIVLNVTESTTANSRQWKYSNVSGGPYTEVIAGATGLSYTPNFPDWGTYYVVCESTNDGVAYISNEVKIMLPLFSKYIYSEFQIGNYGSVAWGDYDNDGDLDMLFTAGYYSTIYMNDLGSFVDVYNGFIAGSYSYAAWGDYDNDGDLDAILMTSSGSRIYKNEAGGFTEINVGLPSVYYGSMSLGDYDNDGDLDILATGSINGIFSALIFRNDNGEFTDINAGLVGVRYSSSDWGDYDNDGDLDILLTGYTTSGSYVSVIYRNDNGYFTDIMAGLPGIMYGSSVWGDYDSDGDLDILLAGYSTTGYFAEIYRNDNGLFPKINAGLTGVRYSSAAWGDYDNDGDPDILLTGYISNADIISRLYRNDNGIFTNVNSTLPGINRSAVAWGDYDNDGDLDLFMTGQSPEGYLSSLFTNNVTLTNDSPVAPSNLQAVAGSNKVTLSWNKSTDPETLQNGLSYNLYIGTAPVTVNIKSPMAELPGGYRRIAQKGQIQKNTWTIKNLHAGSYYWSTQAIDNTLAGSAFAAEGSFAVPFSNSIYPVTEQTLSQYQFGDTLKVNEDFVPASRQWKYSKNRGGPYDQLITGATGTYYIPYFSTCGTFYVVCESVYNSVTYTSNAVKIGVPVFSDQTGIILPELSYSSVAWGDYDSDGDLDILLSGYANSGYMSEIYNNSSGVFTSINAGLPGVYYGSAVWGDYDNDNDLDILLMGRLYSGETISKIYRNDNNVFTDINAGLPGGYSSSASWGDYDNDGDLDILLSCSNFTVIFRNDIGVFNDIDANLPGVTYSSAAWGDYDNDGDLDILLTGLGGEDAISKIYQNNYGIFSDINAGLTGVTYGSVAWGDYDDDGDLDILMTGLSGTVPVSKIYRNDNGVFTDINAGLTGVNKGSVAWGDYDNDGDLDILLSGNNSTLSITKIYNNDNGVFTDIDDGLAGVQASSVAWGDYDNNGSLDILLTGMGSLPRISKIYKNNLLTINSLPAAPANLQSVPGANIVTLSWNRSEDVETLQNSLSYNLYIGTSPGFSGTKSPMAGLPDGYRKIVKKELQTNSWQIKYLPAGTYYWSVQAIDNSFAGSAFSPESSFTVSFSNSVYPVANQSLAINQDGSPLTVVETSPADSRQWKYSTTGGGPYDQIIDGAVGTSYTPVFSSWDTYYVVCVSIKGGIEYTSNEVKIILPVFLEQTEINITNIGYSSVKWGDYDNDGDLDILLVGWTSSGSDISAIYRNDGGQFFDINAGLFGVEVASADWGDYDNDGDLDIVLAGTSEIAQYVSKIYRNDDGIFNDIDADIEGVYYASVAWGDYDNDGDLDILLKGRASSGNISKIYRNENGFFTDVGAGLTGLYSSSGIWGDYDNDGDLDILISGVDSNNERFSIIYRNDGGVFTDIGAGLTGVSLASSAWGDYDNDGDLDILLTGTSSATGERVANIYRNDDGDFTDINAGLPGLSVSSVGWGDYDNDGDLDILLSGSSSTGYITKVFRNDGGVFNDIIAGLPGSYWGSVAWGDYDNDGNLDILLTGYGSSDYISKIYRNTNILANTPPDAPSNLQVSAISLSKVNLLWDIASDLQTPQNTLTYNIRMGSISGGSDVISPMSLIDDGYRQIPKMGNAEFKNDSYFIDNLAPGTYYWSVQSVDQAFAGSVWASESSFTLLEAPVANDASDILYNSLTANWNSSAGATGYSLDISTDEAFVTFVAGYNKNDVGNITSVNISGLSSATTYYYRVWAYADGGTSIFCSNVISATTLSNPPQPPTGLSASSCNGLVTLTWNASTETDFLRYRIYGDLTVNPTTLLGTTADLISETSKIISGLINDRTYYFRVTTMSTSGVESDYSTETSVLVKTGFIPKIKAKFGDILIAYNKGDSIVSFQWYNGNSAIPDETNQYYVTNKAPGDYHVFVTDINGCQNSSNIIAISNSKSLSVYPNPANTSFVLNLNSEAQGKTVVSLINSFGVKVLEYLTEKEGSGLLREIPVSNIQNGIYTIEVSVDNKELNYSRIVIVQ